MLSFEIENELNFLGKIENPNSNISKTGSSIGSNNKRSVIFHISWIAGIDGKS